jgi:hypothetical protein
VLLTVAVLTAACGDDDGLGEGEQALADALAISMMNDADVDNPFTDSEAAQCFADGMVGDIGIERLATLGLTAETQSQAAAFASMSDDELDQIVDIALDCTDPEGVIAAEFVASGISPGSATCLAEELGKSGFFRDAFVAGFAGTEFDPETNPEYTAAFLEAAGECLTAEELGPLFGG